MQISGFSANAAARIPNALRLHLSQGHGLQARRMRSQPLQATAEPESATAPDVESTSGRSDGLMDRPTRPPPPIKSAAPSARTIAAKERAAADRAQQQQQTDGSGQQYNDRPPRGDGRPFASRGGGRGGQRGGGRGGGGRGGGRGGFQQSQGQGRFGNSGPSDASGGNRFNNGPSNSFGGQASGGPGRMTSSGPSSRGGGRGGGGRGGDDRKSWSKDRGANGGRGGGSSNGRRAPKYQAIDIGSRRKARQSRKAEREEERRASARTKEDIFEVGPEGMSVTDLGEMLATSPVEIVKFLFMKGLAVQVNSTLDAETVKLVGLEYGVDVLDKEEERLEESARKAKDFIEEDDLEFLQYRPPVVTVMGHVDHGKTSLLDFIRKSKVAAGEAGGITQSIGAYTCSVNYLDEERQVTFLDTPGHEAFSAMRARGARVTDIAIIIVAADDGVRPQTLEAISHAKAAGVPIVVAINKVDKEGANPERVKQELTEVELIPEEWGGKTPMVAISAKKGQGVDELLETVLLVAELEELQANPDRAARGTVLEACLDKQAGPLTTVLVQNGTLRTGDVIVAGSAYGKVRSMRTPTGDVTEAGPSIAVQVLGLNAVPVAGDDIEVYESEARARQAAEAIDDARRLERLAEMAGGGSMVTLSSLASMDDDADELALQRMNIILKADASGSCEAVKSALGALPQDSVVLRYLLAAPGDITLSDVDLAVASGGMVLGFGVSPSEAVASAAKRAGITMRSYSVIYDLVDDVRAAMEGRLRAVEERVSVGVAEVKAVFGSGARKVAGCMVTEGMMRRGAQVAVRRGKRTLHEGTLSSLRRVKDDVREVEAGTECGIFVEGFRDWEEGDKIEAFDVVEKKLSLEEAHATTIEV